VNFYNEIDRQAAAWLRELIRAGLIPAGVVDERSIKDIEPAELEGFRKCHFFAGIGGWPYALRLAGWGLGGEIAAEAEVWTGSCPCQPFSVAGQNKGTDDERHLWPAFRWLIAQRQPATVFGEQVASKSGRKWLDGVRADLEAMGYVVGAADLCAASKGAPHIRQRLFWVADLYGDGCDKRRAGITEAGGNGAIGSSRLADAAGPRFSQRQNAGAGGKDESEGGRGVEFERGGGVGGLANAKSDGRGICDAANQWAPDAQVNTSTNASNSGIDRSRPDVERVGDAVEPGLERLAGDGDGRNEPRRDETQKAGPVAATSWDDYELIPCGDKKTRRIESGVCPLADGVSGRVGLLRGYGNAIVPRVAAEFVRAFMEVKKGRSKEVRK